MGWISTSEGWVASPGLAAAAKDGSSGANRLTIVRCSAIRPARPGDVDAVPTL